MFDPTHSQVVISYQHLSFSTTSGMFSGVTGTINFEEAKPAASTVSVEFPISSLHTGDTGRDKHLQSADFFDGKGKAPNMSFKSTSIKVTGEKCAQITRDLTLNGVTKPVIMDTVLNHQGQHPIENKLWIGFNATTTMKRTDFTLGLFARLSPLRLPFTFPSRQAQPSNSTTLPWMFNPHPRKSRVLSTQPWATQAVPRSMSEQIGTVGN